MTLQNDLESNLKAAYAAKTRHQKEVTRAAARASKHRMKIALSMFRKKVIEHNKPDPTMKQLLEETETAIKDCLLTYNPDCIVTGKHSHFMKL
jgi:hypothetical protein